MGRFQVIKPHTILGTDQKVGIEVLTSMQFREATGSFAAEISQNGKERKLSAEERDAENERAKVSFCEVLARQVKELDSGVPIFADAADVRAQLSDDQITDAYRQTMRPDHRRLPPDDAHREAGGSGLGSRGFSRRQPGRWKRGTWIK